MVLSSGFLCQHECMTAASTCQNWFHSWKEVEHALPFESKIAIVYGDISRLGSSSTFPHWIKAKHIQGVVRSPEFLRKVFDKVNDLRVAAKPTDGARARARTALPVWGVDIQKACVSVWGPNKYNRGGVYIRLGKAQEYHATYKIRLDTDLKIWTGIRGRAWSAYDKQPIWPCKDEIED